MTETPTPWPDWLEGLTDTRKVTEILCAVAGQYRDDPNEPHRLLVTDAETLILRLLGEAPWRRGADGRWPDGHKCPGCKGPTSEQCNCCAEACDCPPPPAAVPSAERQLVHALMAERAAVIGEALGRVFKAGKPGVEPPGDLLCSLDDDGILTARLTLAPGTVIEPQVPPVAEGIAAGGRWLDIAFAGHNQHAGYVTELEVNGRTVFHVDLPARLWGGGDSAWVEYGADFLFSRSPASPAGVYASWAAERARRERWLRQEAEREQRLIRLALTSGDDPDDGEDPDDDDPWMRAGDDRPF